MKRLNTENKIHKYITEHWEQIFPKFYLIKTYPEIKGFYSNKIIGSADFLFKKNRICYMVELKYSNIGSQDLWGGLKVIGYARAYQLQTGQVVKPVIILRRNLMTHDIKALFWDLKLNYITIDKDIEGYCFEYDFEK